MSTIFAVENSSTKSTKTLPLECFTLYCMRDEIHACGSYQNVSFPFQIGKVNNVSSEDNVYHYLTEAAKFAASHRMLLGDPDSEVGNMKANVVRTIFI